MAKLELRQLVKRFDRKTTAAAVDGVDLTIESGEFFTLLGPSGSGKTTLLRLIGGLESPSSGSIWIDGVDVTRRPPQARDIALVFQNPALYPYLNVFDNLSFSLRARKVAEAEVSARVLRAASPGVLGLDTLLNRKPQTLSGGQRQRVALGRALVRRPSVYLLDEPFSSLDAPLRASLQADLKRLHQESEGTSTILMVTHDQAEALALSDRIGLMDRGRLLGVGTPRSLYEFPEDSTIAKALGHPSMNLLPGKVVDGSPSVLAIAGLDPSETIDPGRAAPFPEGPGFAFQLGLRPDDVAYRPLGDPLPNGFVDLPRPAEVTDVDYLGHARLLRVMIGPYLLRVREEASATPPRRGDLGRLAFDPAKAHWFDGRTGLRLKP